MNKIFLGHVRKHTGSWSQIDTIPSITFVVLIMQITFSWKLQQRLQTTLCYDFQIWRAAKIIFHGDSKLTYHRLIPSQENAIAVPWLHLSFLVSFLDLPYKRSRNLIFQTFWNGLKSKRFLNLPPEFFKTFSDHLSWFQPETSSLSLSLSLEPSGVASAGPFAIY